MGEALKKAFVKQETLANYLYWKETESVAKKEKEKLDGEIRQAVVIGIIEPGPLNASLKPSSGKAVSYKNVITALIEKYGLPIADVQALIDLHTTSHKDSLVVE